MVANAPIKHTKGKGLTKEKIKKGKWLSVGHIGTFCYAK